MKYTMWFVVILLLFAVLFAGADVMRAQYDGDCDQTTASRSTCATTGCPECTVRPTPTPRVWTIWPGYDGDFSNQTPVPDSNTNEPTVDPTPVPDSKTNEPTVDPTPDSSKVERVTISACREYKTKPVAI